jgi:hypothetical protein
MERDEMVKLLQDAFTKIQSARALAPNKTNLSDELDNLGAQCDRLQSAVQCREYDDFGWSK